MSALLSSCTSQQGKSPDCSSMFFRYISNSYSAAEFRRKSKISTCCDCVGEVEVNSSPHPVLFLGPMSLFAKSNCSPALHLRGSNAAPLCENCARLFLSAVSSSLCRMWSWILLKQAEELFASAEGLTNISVCMPVLFSCVGWLSYFLVWEDKEDPLSVIYCKVFPTMRRQGCSELVLGSAVPSPC